MSKVFTVPATIEGVSPLKDGGCSIRLHTQDMSRSQMVDLMDFYNTFGYMLFSESELNEEDVPEDKLERGEKTPSQRLRAVLFITWQEKGSEGDFNVFYRQQMEKIINLYKDKLN